MFPIPTPGAIGSIETPDDKVRELAEKSHRFVCPKCKASKNSLPPRPFPVCSNLLVSFPFNNQPIKNRMVQWFNGSMNTYINKQTHTKQSIGYFISLPLRKMWNSLFTRSKITTFIHFSTLQLFNGEDKTYRKKTERLMLKHT